LVQPTHHRRFYLSEQFLDNYKGKQPEWGPVGYIVYKRTYARKKDDGTTEEFWETLKRVVEGVFNIQKDHVAKNGLRWDNPRSQKTAQEMYDAMWNFKFLPSGRNLWMMGTDYVKDRSGAGLLNCAFASTENIVARGGEIFEFLMDCLMLGVGAGFDTLGANKIKVKEPKETNGLVFDIPDSREGWVESVGLLLNAYFNGSAVPRFNYDLIRAFGKPIKGFGGTASGPKPLQDLHENITNLLTERIDEYLTSSDIVDIETYISKCVIAGNIRRSASLALGNPDDNDYLELKHDQKKLMSHRYASNNSVAATVGMDYSQCVKNTVKQGEPGYVWLDNARKYGRMGELRDDSYVMGVNPCVTGNTLVYVADGRGNVPIKQLAEEEKDIPVFCFDSAKKITVRTMRNPRITGIDVPVYEILLDDGSSLKVTGNHKFLTTDGEYIDAKSLKFGESLKVTTRFEASIKDIFPKSNSTSQNYFWIKNNSSSYAEHRFISAFNENLDTVPKHFVVHHKDFNAQNNSPGNLKIMSKKDHDKLHGDAIRGDNNPMRRAATEWSEEKWKDYREKQSINNSGKENSNYSGITNEELQEHALKLTKKLERRFSVREWDAYAKAKKLPRQFSKWRNDHLGGIIGLSKWAAIQCNFQKFMDLDPRTVRAYKEWTKEGYNCEIIDGHVKLIKSCEHCSKKLSLEYKRREQSLCATCSTQQSNTKLDHIKARKEGMKKTYAKKCIDLKQKQLKVFTKLQFDLKRAPQKQEWAEACKNSDISAELGRKSSPFTSWNLLKEDAETFNHRVVSVKLVGKDTVYNGTVDEFHNFFIGGFERNTRSGKRKWLYLNNLQCGEQTLEDRELCNLVETFPAKHDTYEDFKCTLKLAYLYGKSVTLVNTHWPETNARMLKNRRIGLSQSGITQAFNKHGRRTMLQWSDDGYKYIQELDKNFSDWLAIPKSIKTTTVKPSGSVSLLPQATPGIHYPEAEFYIRRIRFSINDPLLAPLKKAGYHIEEDQYDSGRSTMVVEFPVQEKYFAKSKYDVSIWEQLENAAKYQQYWSDNSVSITVTFKPEEARDIKNALELYEDRLKSVSFLPLTEHGYAQAPYEAIDEKRYKVLIKKLKKINFTKVVSEASGEKYCDGDTCQV
jgi:ribonucleotide reductase alpha subunit